ncbi:hypothetical protein Pint_10860 [Pistacia integerrima]|uniref:Uncharacterized protein n=1 Tax=Pistacia integerrima TaxID=434235 RepID=A0ACC0XHF9_9ROSI|nr:hypothetical protein Pint_10860 [Pistacia integerrima]
MIAKPASQDGERLCPNKTEAVVWEEVCQLRYSNENFFGRLDVRGNIPKFNVKNVSEPERYKSVVKKILSNLIKAAAFDPSTEMYATGNVSFTDTDTLHALVQCTRDLSAHDCNTCLETAIADISSCCYFSRGARLLSRSCYLRYELYAFYEGVTEPAATDENRATGKGNQRKIWIIIILSIVLVCLILLVALACAVYCIRTRKGSRKREAQVNIQVQSNNSRDHNRTDFRDQHAWQLWNEGNAWELMDPLLTDTTDHDEFLRYFQIGLLCVQDDTFDRPTMSSAVVMEKANGFEMH